MTTTAKMSVVTRMSVTKAAILDASSGEPSDEADSLAVGTVSTYWLTAAAAGLEWAEAESVAPNGW
jgi:hypothetical protein